MGKLLGSGQRSGTQHEKSVLQFLWETAEGIVTVETWVA